MAELNADQVSYIMVVLKNSEMEIDWKSITLEAGISKPSNAQRKFRQIIEATGYRLVNNKIIGADGDNAAVATPVATPSQKKRKSPAKKDTNGEASKKKHKGSQPIGEIAVNGEGKIEVEGAEEGGE